MKKYWVSWIGKNSNKKISFQYWVLGSSMGTYFFAALIRAKDKDDIIEYINKHFDNVENLILNLVKRDYITIHMGPEAPQAQLPVDGFENRIDLDLSKPKKKNTVKDRLESI